MIRISRCAMRIFGAIAIAALITVLAACSGPEAVTGPDNGPPPVTGPGTGNPPGTGPVPGTPPVTEPNTGNPPGTGSEPSDPGAVGTYTLTTVNGVGMPFLFDDVVLGPSRIQSYILGGTMELKADGKYTASVYSRWIMNGNVINRTASGSGSWTLVGDGTLRLTPNTGGSVELLRTWYTLTETRGIPAGSGVEVDLIYVWVLD